jgi:uncharacterized protein (DUF1015 family)
VYERFRTILGSDSLRRVPRIKPFRALRYDPAVAGPLETVVAPPHDVISDARRDELLAASPYNIVRLIRPSDAADAGRLIREWQAEGVLTRDAEPAVWVMDESFTGPDGEARTRRSLLARVRVEPYGEGEVYPHERTFRRQKMQRLELLRATGTKLSPIFLMHDGPSPADPDGTPDVEVDFDGVHVRLWRVPEPAASTLAEAVRTPFVIADGHHRYETALRYHQEEGTEESAHVLAALVSRTDPGLEIFPTHRVAGEPVPALNGRFQVTDVDPAADAALAALDGLGRERPGFVVLERNGARLAEAEPDGTPVGVLDTAVLDELELADVRYTPYVAEAEDAVRDGTAAAAFLVRAPTVDQVEAVALAGETMPQKSTYFFPKLTSGLVLAPYDE